MNCGLSGGRILKGWVAKRTFGNRCSAQRIVSARHRTIVQISDCASLVALFAYAIVFVLVTIIILPPPKFQYLLPILFSQCHPILYKYILVFLLATASVKSAILL